MLLANKKIVIIGGTSGIGLSAAKAFLKEGANLVVAGLDDEHIQTATNHLGDNAVVIASDSTKENSAAELIDICEEKWNGFDGIFHVAGGSGRKLGDGPLHELTLEGWKKTFDLNLTSLMMSNQAAVKKFIALNKGGSIVNMSSVLAFSPSPGFFATHAYAAAKSAIIGFSKSIAAYYASQNIRVNVIAPGLIATPMSQRAANDELIVNFIKTKQPLDGGRMGLPEDVDGLATLLLSDAAAFITGQVIAVDGGWSVSEGR